MADERVEYIAQFAPPASKARASYAHLKGLQTESGARGSSRDLLAAESPRSPQSLTQQQLDLTICGGSSSKRRSRMDETLQQLAPEADEAVAALGGVRSGVVRLINTFDRVLQVVWERLQELESEVAQRRRRASAAPFRSLLTKLYRDTHKLYRLLAALATVVAPDQAQANRQQQRLAEDVVSLANFDYNQVRDQPDPRVTVQLVRRWYAPQGKIATAYEVARGHLQAILARGLTEHVPDAFDKVDDQAARCLERVAAAREFLGRMDMRTAATTALAAVRFRLRSPSPVGREAKQGDSTQ